MKLREEEPAGATLIQYDRADEAQARESRYRLVRDELSRVAELAQALEITPDRILTTSYADQLIARSA